MNKFRKWVFKFLTGYEFVDYKDMLRLACEINDLNKRIVNDQKDTLDLARDVNSRCEYLIEQIKEMKKNETLG